MTKIATLEAGPTVRLYSMLERAYDELNESLFGGGLPSCLLTLQRKRRVYGYFCAGRFGPEDDKLDEIALSPMWFLDRPPDQLLSTLAHEMAHLWQHHFGKPTKSNPHNREWGTKMKEIGLPPEGPGGKETGRNVSHRIDPEGAFKVAAEDILTFFKPDTGDIAPEIPPQTSGRYSRYLCEECGVKALGKPGLDLRCGPDHGPMMQVS